MYRLIPPNARGALWAIVFWLFDISLRYLRGQHDNRPKTQGVLRKMMESYVSYKTQREVLELTGGNSDFIDSLKDSTITQIRELATFNENTQAAYDSLFARLLGD